MSNDESASNETTADEILYQQEFGVCLREAREKRGLTVQEIAEQLHLKEEIVKALESSSVDSLPAPTFTRGYIRAYARLLKLSEDEILDIYNANIPDKEVPLVPNSGMSAQFIDDAAKFRPFVILLVLCFVALLAYLLVDFDTQLKVDSNLQSNQQLVDVVENDDSQSQVLSDEAHADAVAQDAADRPQELIQSEAEPTSVSVEPSEVAPEVNINQEIKLSSQTKTEILVESEPESQSEAVVEEQSGVVVEGDDVLEFVTVAATWAEVQDLNGHRLIFELLKKDQTYQVKGMAPFKVFLGNAPAVKMLVNNHAVDITNYIRKNNIVNITVEDNGIVQVSRRDRIIFNSNDENTQQEPSLSDAENAEDL